MPEFAIYMIAALIAVLVIAKIMHSCANSRKPIDHITKDPHYLTPRIERWIRLMNNNPNNNNLIEQDFSVLDSVVIPNSAVPVVKTFDLKNKRNIVRSISASADLRINHIFPDESSSTDPIVPKF